MSTAVGNGDDTPPGIAADAPASQRSVATRRGYMVPYTARIPGSEVTFQMVPIPGGTFQMGSPPDEAGRRKDEGPEVEVRIASFWMSAHEITWGEYKQYMALLDVFRSFDAQGIRAVTAERKCDAVTAPSRLYDPDSTFASGDDPRQPAVMMTQYAARQYTHWLSRISGQFYRLPSEAEWEYACRAGSTTPYHFDPKTGQLADYAWYQENAKRRTHVVGEKKPNAWGLFDMHGNVAEWVLDAYRDSGYEDFRGQARDAAAAIAWPTRPFPIAARGGSWEMTAAACRSAARLASDDEEWKIDDPNLPASPWWYTASPSTGVGFRIVRPLDPPADAGTRQRFWQANLKEVAEDVEFRLNEQDSGAIGIVDPDLPAAIKKLDTGQQP